MIKKISNLKLIFIGALLGGVVFLKPIFLLLFILLGVIAIFLSKVNRDDRAALTKVVFIGLILRLLFSFISLCYIPIFYSYYPEQPLFMRLIGHTSQLFRDFYREILNGVHLGRYFAYGNSYIPLTAVAVEGKTSYLNLSAYTLGVLNFIFGESLLNILAYPFFSIWMIVLVYYLAKEVFDRNVAILASFVLAALPSFIIWSCINIRTSIAITSILLLGWSLVKFRKCNHIKYLIPFFIALWLFNLAKDKFSEPIMLLSVVGLFLSINFNHRIKIMLIILMLVVGLILIKTNSAVQSKMYDFTIRMIINQKNYYLTPTGNNYKIYDDFVYYEDLERIDRQKITVFTLLRGLPKGMSYFLFAPFPWEVTNTLILYSYPQIIFWYFIFPFSIWGIYIGIQHNRQDMVFLLLIPIFWTILLSLTIGNVGTAARHRDIISPFFYIFASAALCNLLGLSKMKEKP